MSSTPSAYSEAVSRVFALPIPAFPQVIPEGAGSVKTHGWLFFHLFAGFLILAGASK